jgi:hypothetical protein
VVKDADDGGNTSSSRWLGRGFGVSGTAMLGFSTIQISGFVDAFVSRAPIIVWDESGWIVLPIAVALLALAIGLHIGRHDGPNVDGPRSDAIRRLLALAACMLPFVIVLPFSAYWIFGWQLEARGYKECIDGVWAALGRVPDVPETPAPCRNLSGNLGADGSRIDR